MKNLRTIRVVLAAIFLGAAVAYIFLGPRSHPMVAALERVQIIPSLLSITIGSALFWLAVTFLFGRVYCATACPVGTLVDLAARLRRFAPGARRTYHYHHARKIRHHILLVYLVAVLAGIIAVPLLLEPWNMVRDISIAVRPDEASQPWLTLGLGAATGIAAGALSLLLIFISGIYFGRDFCNVVCPIGTMTGMIHSRTLFHIEIDPDKCINCMRCEEECSSSCVKVVGRYVDNARCVRCMKCLSVCPNDAIRLQQNRNRRSTPLMRRVSHAGKP